MNARSVLNMVADDLRSDGMNGETIGDRDAAALRELDLILAETADCIKYNCERNNNGPVNKKLREIEFRLSQAGYGEK